MTNAIAGDYFKRPLGQSISPFIHRVVVHPESRAGGSSEGPVVVLDDEVLEFTGQHTY